MPSGFDWPHLLLHLNTAGTARQLVLVPPLHVVGKEGRIYWSLFPVRFLGSWPVC